MASRCPVALITGAAQGIGYAISKRLLQEGYRVCVADINEEKGKDSVHEFQEKYASDKVMFVKCDTTSEASYRGAFSAAKEKFGQIDLVVNNAGIVDEFDRERTIAVNLMGPIIGCQLALSIMGTSNGGKGGIVVNTASIVGVVAHENIPVYTASKHGVVGLTRSYGRPYHFEKNGIIFMAICPYYVRTPLLVNAKILEKFNKEAVAQKIEPEFVAEGVIKLLKDKCNGSTLAVLPGEMYYADIEERLKRIVM